MSRKRIGPEERLTEPKRELAAQLAAELRANRDHGQPMIWEQTFRTGKMRVTVLWDKWNGIPLQERTATILRAYEQAEGPEARARIALASGLTVPEAHVAGMLPYQIIPALRRGDPITAEQARQAMLEEGASQLANPPELHLRFPTEEEAQAARQRLIRRFPGSDDIWIVNREITANDLAGVSNSAEAEEM
jgi:hypothetical protein